MILQGEFVRIGGGLSLLKHVIGFTASGPTTRPKVPDMCIVTLKLEDGLLTMTTMLFARAVCNSRALLWICQFWGRCYHRRHFKQNVKSSLESARLISFQSFNHSLPKADRDRHTASGTKHHATFRVYNGGIFKWLFWFLRRSMIIGFFLGFDEKCSRCPHWTGFRWILKQRMWRGFLAKRERNARFSGQHINISVVWIQQDTFVYCSHVRADC